MPQYIGSGAAGAPRARPPFLDKERRRGYGPCMSRNLQIRVVRPKLQGNLAVLKLSGFINASTVLDFESAIDSLLLEKKLDVVVDMGEVEYVNSTGISAILTYHQSWRGKGDELVLIRVSPPLFNVLNLLGVPALVPILADEAEAVEYLRRTLTGQRVHASHVDFLLRREKKAGAAPPPPPSPASVSDAAAVPREHAVLVVDPEQSLFSEVMRLRFKGGQRRYHLVHSGTEALLDFDRIQPDLVILRDASPQADAFVSKIKIEKKRSLVSILRVYPRGSDPHRQNPFKIWENDFFVEPFDVSELFALAEMELKRVPEDRRTLLHHTVFRFTSTDVHVEKAGALMGDLLQHADLSADDRSSLLAAFKEAVDNACRHGHRFDPAKSIEVLFTLEPERVTVEVADEGEGFPYATYLNEMKNEEAYVKACRTRAQGKRGGLGILMMSRCADALEYLDRGNRIRLRKNLVPPSLAARLAPRQAAAGAP